MPAATSDRTTQSRALGVGRCGLSAAAIIFAGCLVCYAADGYIVDGADTAGLRFAGVARKAEDNTGGADDDIEATYFRSGEFRFASSGLVATDVGRAAYLIDNQTVGPSDHASVDNNVYVGVITEVISATVCWVELRPGDRSQNVDLDGEVDALILDADGDTTISAPTDDQIDIEISGADDFRFTANTFTALAGSSIATDTIAETTAAAGVTVDGVLLKDGTVDVNGNSDGIVLDADADTTISADTDDQIDVKIAGADDFQFVANVFRALAGSSIETDTISERTAAAGVTIDGVLLKDGVNQGLLHSANVFRSAELTGNGAEQDTAHGLGAIPALVFVVASNLTGGVYVVSYGAHDGTNVKTTVTTGEKYRVVAFK